VLSLGTSDFDLNVVLFKENVSAIKKYGLLLKLVAKFKELKFDCQRFITQIFFRHWKQCKNTL
jgi:hypothetical protein